MSRILSVGLLLAAVITVPLGAQESFELPTYDDSVRWDRAATLFIVGLVADLAKSKDRGLTASEAGRESAELFGPPNGWNNADTPFVLFRGMYFNLMSHPDQTCELLEASETRVRARCNRPWVDYFGSSGSSYGVTLAEYEDSFEAFASGIADAHDMEWMQSHEGDDLVITVRTR